MRLTFLGTGGAWGLPELNCDCLACREMRQKKERRKRTSLLLRAESTLLIDCGPDAAMQLSEHHVERPDAILITHEHGDHYMGLDELVSYKRASPRGQFRPIPVYMTQRSWDVIEARFGYLVEMDIIRIHPVSPLETFAFNEFEITPFKTNHGNFASGSVGYLIQGRVKKGHGGRLIYTSDFFEISPIPPELSEPDVLVIQSFWLNEPAKNVPQHMSFQRALPVMESLRPKKEIYLVHIGDGDPIPGDPANRMLKKRAPADQLRSPENGEPYPIPIDQVTWQKTVDLILRDRGLTHRITVACDGLTVEV